MSRPYRILLVDDSEVNQELWGGLLEAEGYRVTSARRGEEALACSESSDFDLVLLDVMMPGLSGFEVLESLRADRSSRELPVIMATARDRSEDVVRAFGLGANDYVTKPLDPAITLARIAAQLRQHRERDAARAAEDEGDDERAGNDADREGSRGREEGPRPVEEGGPRRGAVIDSKYRIESLLGYGNFGAVYRARHLELQRPVALKVLRSTVHADAVSLARFRQEGISLSRLDHPNVVKVLDFGTSASALTYLVMELLDGRSLLDELEAEGVLSVSRTLELILPVCEVLAEAHELGIIHRDVKPHNVFLHRDRRGERVKVLDFGISKLVGDAELEERLTLAGGSVGTPAYMAPERFMDEEYDGRSDVYSLGIVIYEMLSGSTPFADSGHSFFRLIRHHVGSEPEPLHRRVGGLPPELEELVHAALAKESADRPSAAELAAGLHRVAESLPPEPPEPRVEAGDPPVARSPSPTVEVRQENDELNGRPT